MRRCMFIDWDALVQLLEPILAEPSDAKADQMIDRAIAFGTVPT